MGCPGCGNENVRSQKFCGHCGQPLERRCPSCQAGVTAETTFCGSCGTRLGDTAHTVAREPAAGATGSVMAGERRQATILVSRLAFDESLIEQALPDEIDHLVERLEEVARDVVDRFGGMIDRIADEEVVALFGIPVAHEDDALRAARAALELHARLKDGLLGGAAGEGLKLSSAIHTGRVVTRAAVAGRAGPSIVGESVSVALGLARAAEPGQILLTPASHRVAGAGLRTEPLDPVRIRSSGDPLVPHRVLGAEDLSGPAMNTRGIALTPFSGRQAELATLIDCVETAVAGEGQFAAVIGEAGAGKTRLLFELRRRLQDRDVGVFEGRCKSHGERVAYVPWIQACRGLLGLSDEAMPRAQHDQAVAAVLDIDDQLEPLLPVYLHLLSIPSEDYPPPEGLEGRHFRHAASEGLAALFTLAARKRPLVLLLEDWHWVDDASHGVVQQLEEMCSDYPLLVAVSSRPDPAPDWGVPDRHRMIHLGALAEDPATRIMQSVLGAEQLPTGLAPLLHERTGGNPFFLEEVCRTLHEDGTVQVEDSRVLVGESLDRLHLPDTVQAVIRTRLDRIDPEARKVLRCASVIGRDFSTPVLSRVVETSEHLEAILERLKQRGLIRQTRVVPRPIYRFQHALTQEVAYDSLLARQRQTLHGRAGRAIEAVHANRLEEYYDQLSRHFGEAESWLEAVDYGRRAIARLLELSQFPEAIEPLERASGWLARLPENEVVREHRVALLLDEELVRDTVGERDRQRAIIGELLDILQPGDDRAELITAYTRQADLLAMTGDFADGERVLELALEVSRRLEDTDSERDTLRSLSFLLWQQRRYEDALEALDGALKIDRASGDRQRISGDLTNRGSVLRGLGRYHEALESLEEALTLIPPTSVRRCETQYIIGNVYRDLGEDTKAREYQERSLEFQTESRYFTIHLPITVQALATLSFEQGDMEKGIDLLRRILELRLNAPNSFGLAQCQQTLAEMLTAVGRPEEALPHLLESATLFRRSRDEAGEVRVLAVAAPILEQGGRSDEARGAWEQVLDLSDKHGWGANALDAHRGLAGLAEGAGQLELAVSHLGAAIQLTETVTDCPKRGTLLNQLGIVYWKRGKYLEAVDCYSEALRVLRSRGETADVGVILNSLGATLGKLGRRDEADQRLDEAIAAHRKTGQDLLLGHALALKGDLRFDRGDSHEALVYYEESLGLRRRVSNRRGEGWMLHHQARALSTSGDGAAGKERAKRGAAIAAELGDRELADACARLVSAEAGEGPLA